MSRDSLQATTTYAAVMGRVLAMKREEAGLEQADVAKEMGISQSAWSRIERGETVLNVEQLHRAAKIVRASAEQIVEQTETASEDLKDQSVNVTTVKEQKSSGGTLALIGVAALAALVLHALTKK